MSAWFIDSELSTYYLKVILNMPLASVIIKLVDKLFSNHMIVEISFV